MSGEGIELDIQEFRAWLLSQGPDAAIGMTCRPNKCPVATWLKGKYGREFMIDGTRFCDSACPGTWHVAPYWVGVFVKEVDACYGHVPASVPVSVALDIVTIHCLDM